MGASEIEPVCESALITFALCRTPKPIRPVRKDLYPLLQNGETIPLFPMAASVPAIPMPQAYLTMPTSVRQPAQKTAPPAPTLHSTSTSPPRPVPSPGNSLLDFFHEKPPQRKRSLETSPETEDRRPRPPQPFSGSIVKQRSKSEGSSPLPGKLLPLTRRVPPPLPGISMDKRLANPKTVSPQISPEAISPLQGSKSPSGHNQSGEDLLAFFHGKTTSQS